jgi:hypothetical protein
MLFNLKDNRKKKTSIPRGVILGAIKKFTPLDIPTYRAGYLMNLTTDTPPGSIVAPPTAYWYDAKVLAATSKLMVRGTQTVTGLVNGFKCENIDIATSRLRNTTTDVFTGVTNFSYIFGFKRNTAGVGHQLLSVRNDADSVGCFSLLQNDGKIRITYGASGNFASAITSSRYDDNTWHAFVGIMDQTNKTSRVITDTGEDISATNAALPAPTALTNTSSNYFQFGAWWPNTNYFAPGFFGDIVIFNSVLTALEITAVMAWEKDRLGI